MTDAQHAAERPLANGHTRIDFQTEPARYRHWKLEVDGDVATLLLDVDEKGALFEGYELKLNSYDLGVDIELADAIERLRFEHPQVRVVVLRSGKPRVFCAGANIRMLAGASHAHKVNFCKFTNETRNGIEDLSEHSGLKTICAISGTAAGGGYELALAADHIMLVDDGSSAVALPELPLLGGAARNRRPHPRHRQAQGPARPRRRVLHHRGRRQGQARARLAAGRRGDAGLEVRRDDCRAGQGVRREIRPRRRSARHQAHPAGAQLHADGVDYGSLAVEFDRAARVATITLRGPAAPPPASVDALAALGAEFWPLKLARELDDAILHIRLNEFDVAAIVFKSSGDPAEVVAYEQFLDAHNGHWLVREIRHLWKRVLKRVDLTSRSLATLIEPGSCFAGTLAEIAFASDRSYMLIGRRDGDNKPPATIVLTDANFGAYPMPNGLTRLASRFLGDPADVETARAERGKTLDAEAAQRLGLVTFALDDIDWDDEVRVFLEERASFSPDGLTGMEANLRFAGPETMETKIFARLTAWQNWIFQRPNAVGEEGALKRYGTGQKPVFDTRRV